MISLSSLLGYYFYVLLAAIFLYAVGHFILSFFNKIANPYISAFFKFILGLVLAIVFYAVLKTGFRTCLLPIVPILFYIGFSQNISILNFKNNYRIINAKGLILLFAFITIAFVGLLFGWVYNIKEQTLYSIFDFHYYAQVSSFLSVYGIESPIFDFLDPKSVSVYPYHFDMLWMNSLLSDLLGTNHMLTLLLVVLPILFGLIAFSVSALSTILFPQNKWILYFGPIIWFLAPWDFLKTKIYSGFSTTIGLAISSDPKAIFVFLFFVAAIICFCKRNYFVAALLLVIMSLLYLPILPGIFAAITLTAGFAVFKKLFSIKEFIAVFCFMILSCVWIIALYYVLQTPLKTSMLEPGMILQKHLASRFSGMIGAILRLCQLLATTLSPFILLWIALIWPGRKRYVSSHSKLEFAFIIFTALSTTVWYAFFFSVIDAEQYFTKSFLPLLIILLALLILYAINAVNKGLRVFALIIITVSLFWTKPFVYSYQNRHQIRVNMELTKNFMTDHHLQKAKEIRMAYMNDDCFFLFENRYNSRAYVPFKYFNYFFDPFVTASLDMPIVDGVPTSSCVKEYKNSYTVENLRERLFQKYVDTQKLNHTFKDINISRVDFIKAYNIQYLAWDERLSLSPEIAKIIDSSSILKDTVFSYHFTNYYIASVKTSSQ